MPCKDNNNYNFNFWLNMLNSKNSIELRKFVILFYKIADGRLNINLM